MRVCNHEDCRMLDFEEYPSREQAEGTKSEWEPEPVAQWECKICGHSGFDVVGRTASLFSGGDGSVDLTITTADG